MKRRNNSKIFIIILILLISIGFAYLSQTLNINGAATIFGNSWKVIWDDTSINVVNGSVSSTTPTVDDNKTTVTYNVTLNNPGDYYEFSIDAYNQGSLDAMVNSVAIIYKENNTQIDLPNEIKHTITYADGTELNRRDLLKAGEKQKYYINIEYDRNTTESTLISTNRSIDVTMKINYDQADKSANEKVINNDTLCLNNKHLEITSNTVCKRATTLHTEICDRDDTDYCIADGYNKGDTIIYGNCGTINTLSSGDAFDCDLTGNGTFDERFYFISLKDGISTSTDAVLIYDKNNKSDIYNDSGSNLNGPVTLIPKLPNDWTNSNINLITTRQLKNELNTTTQNSGDELGTITINKRSRLITYQEVVAGCGSENLNNCIYLFEGTAYSSGLTGAWWFETPYSGSSDTAYKVHIQGKAISRGPIDRSYSIRPVIEVPLKNIAY